MKRFQFQFATVLKFRKTLEEQALLRLSEAQRIFQGEVKKRSDLIVQLQNSLKRREELAVKPVPISVFHAEQDFISGTKQRIIQSEQSIFRAGRWVEKSLRVYLGARKQSKIMETLQANAYAGFRKELGKREEKETNDMILMRHRMSEKEFG